jgi:pantothenate kinase-related protein Tda10
VLRGCDGVGAQYRGNAATHDMALGTRTLQELTSAQGAVRVPRYDKSQFGGRGDRAAEEGWPQLEGPLDVVLFEGWMAGFRCPSPLHPLNQTIHHHCCHTTRMKCQMPHFKVFEYLVLALPI